MPPTSRPSPVSPLLACTVRVPAAAAADAAAPSGEALNGLPAPPVAAGRPGAAAAAPNAPLSRDCAGAPTASGGLLGSNGFPGFLSTRAAALGACTPWGGALVPNGFPLAPPWAAAALCAAGVPEPPLTETGLGALGGSGPPNGFPRPSPPALPLLLPPLPPAAATPLCAGAGAGAVGGARLPPAAPVAAGGGSSLLTLRTHRRRRTGMTQDPAATRVPAASNVRMSLRSRTQVKERGVRMNSKASKSASKASRDCTCEQFKGRTGRRSSHSRPFCPMRVGVAN